MKPIEIKKILDRAYNMNKVGQTFVPLFTGDAGIGKSQIAQEWVRDKQKVIPSFGFLDLRIAYLEAPDFVGMPYIEGGRQKFATPDYWPTEGEGLILVEEPNRGNIAMRNCLMQLLTDRKVGAYTIPKGWLIAGCINPDNEHYEVDQMDTALKNRFVDFEVHYDHDSFVSYITDKKWHPELTRYIKSGMWKFKKPDEIGNSPGTMFVSPRSLMKLNVLEWELETNGFDHQILSDTAKAVFGQSEGAQYYKYRVNERPVLFRELIENRKQALKDLEVICDPKTYKGGLISITCDDLVENYNENHEKLLVDVIKIIPKDQAFFLLDECLNKVTKKLFDSLGDDTTPEKRKSENKKLFDGFIERNPEVKTVLKAALGNKKQEDK